MPIVSVTMIEGRTDEQKRAMYREVTEALHRTLDAPHDSIRIIINEIPALHIAAAGVAKSGPSGAGAK